MAETRSRAFVEEEEIGERVIEAVVDAAVISEQNSHCHKERRFFVRAGSGRWATCNERGVVVVERCAEVFDIAGRVRSEGFVWARIFAGAVRVFASESKSSTIASSLTDSESAGG